jgi:hypothetical protein
MVLTSVLPSAPEWGRFAGVFDPYTAHAASHRRGAPVSLHGGNPVSPVCPLVELTRFPRVP